MRGTQYKWLDLASLCRRLMPGTDINRIRYFSARIKSRPDGDPQAPMRQHVYLRALETLPGLTIHLGHFLVTYPRMAVFQPQVGDPRTIQVIKTEEKGSDVNLATYMILDACRRDCDEMVLISNDSDLAEPLRLARDELGVRTCVINPQHPLKRSRALIADVHKQLRPSSLAVCQLPDELGDSYGRKIRRPAAW